MKEQWIVVLVVVLVLPLCFSSVAGNGCCVVPNYACYDDTPLSSCLEGGMVFHDGLSCPEVNACNDVCCCENRYGTIMRGFSCQSGVWTPASGRYAGSPGECSAYCLEATTPGNETNPPGVQTFNISGKVNNSLGVPIWYAKVYIDGFSQYYAVTDKFGVYKIENVPKNLDPGYMVRAHNLSEYAISDPKRVLLDRNYVDVDFTLVKVAGPACSFPVPVLSFAEVWQEPSVQLSWTMGGFLPESCGTVLGFVVYRCDETYGDCMVLPWSPSVNEFKDTNLVAETKYCYKVEADILQGGVHSWVASNDALNPACPTIGHEYCLSPHDREFCDDDVAYFCAMGDEDMNELKQKVDCKTLPREPSHPEPAHCIIEGAGSEATARCIDAQPCANCTGIFGLTSFLDPALQVDLTREYQCALTEKTFCYLDKAKLTNRVVSQVDVLQSCTEVQTCADYNTKEACTTDPCDRLVGNCTWQYSFGVFGMGYCEVAGEQTGACERCAEIRQKPLGSSCSKDECERLNPDCYYNEFQLYDAEPLPGACVGKQSMACAFYDAPEDCVGDRNVSVNISYRDDLPVNGSHWVTESNDKFGFGKCQWWTGTNEYCIKNADNYIDPADPVDDCGSLRGTSPECLRDVNAPTTESFLVARNNYTLGELARGNFFVVRDPENNFGSDPEHSSKTFARFCLYNPSIEDACYPNQTFAGMSYHGSFVVPEGNYRLRFFSTDAARNFEVPVQESPLIHLKDDGTPRLVEVYVDGVRIVQPFETRSLKPNITLVFDRPVRMQSDFPVLDVAGRKINLTFNGSNAAFTVFSYKPSQYLSSGEYSIFVEFKSRVNEEIVAASYDQHFKVVSSTLPIRAVGPVVYGTTVLSGSASFDLVIDKGPLSAECFAGLTPETTTIPMAVGENSDQRQIASSRLGPLATDSGSDLYLDHLTQVWVKCVDASNALSYQDFFVGIDVTPPAVTSIIAPREVKNFGMPFFLFNFSADDHVVCSFFDGDPRVNRSVNFFDFDPSQMSDYRIGSLPRIVDVAYIKELGFPENVVPHVLSYPLTCTNLVGAVARLNATVVVNFSVIIEVSLLSPPNAVRLPDGSLPVLSGWAGRDIWVNVTTDVPVSSCKFVMNGGAVSQQLNEIAVSGTPANGYVNFSTDQVAGVVEGVNNISVNCTLEPRKPGFVERNFSFKYDGELPTVGIVAMSRGCEVGKLTARFVGNDSGSGVANFSVSLFEGTSLLAREILSPEGVSNGSYSRSFTYNGSPRAVEEGKEYTWKVVAIDNALNPSGEVSLAIHQNVLDTSCMVPLSIKTKIPRLGISALEPNFDVTIETNRTAQCKWSVYNRSWAQMSGIFLETPPNASLLHRMRWMNNFSSNINVTCMDSQGFLHSSMIYLGYDPTSPVLNVFDVVPNPVIDFVTRSAWVTVETTEDEVYCECTGDSVCLSLLNKSVADYHTYTPVDNFLLNYTGIVNGFNTNSHFRYALTCSNGADPRERSLVERPFEVVVSLTDGVVITLVKPENVTNVDDGFFSVRTNIVSQCGFKKEGESAFTPFGNEGTSFNGSLGVLSQGLHAFTVQCDSGSNRTSKEFTVLVDKVPPEKVNVGAKDPQCGLVGLVANVSSRDNGTGIRNYSYLLTMTSNQIDIPVANGSVRAGNSAMVTYDGALQSNATYYWRVLATDGAGNVGEAGLNYTRVYDPKSKECDFSKPRATLKEFPKNDNTTDLLVGCTDADSGCLEKFKYSKLNIAQPCTYLSEETLGKFVTTGEKIRFCYAVYDQILNNASGWKIVDVYHVPGQCTNGVKDVNETGVDCGGVCVPCQIPECGDGKVNSKGEDCDLQDFGKLTTTGCTDPFFMGGFTGGRLKCSSACKLDTSECLGEVGGKCKDNTINPRESCEPDIFSSLGCKDMYVLAIGGNISCSSCKMDTSKCMYASVGCQKDSDCGSRVCDARNKTCQRPKCSDGVKNGDEGGVDCGGSCPTRCKTGLCGDGVVNNPGEVCDVADFGSIKGCTDPLFKGAFTGGSLSCTASCRINVSACAGALNGSCGNNAINAGESCDPASSVVAKCDALYTGSSGGELFCSQACALDASLCEFAGTGCGTDDDCESGFCTDGVCLQGSCTDGLVNQNESGVDCGGNCPAKCAGGDGCRSNEDCQTGFCDMDKLPHTCISNPDTDKDGIPDQCELLWGLDPNDGADGYLDTDKDNLTNREEYAVALRFNHTGTCAEATKINVLDSDGDGWSDGTEVSRGFDPTDAKSHPGGPEEEDPSPNVYFTGHATPLIAIIFLIVGLVLVLGGGGYLGYAAWMEKLRPKKEVPRMSSQAQSPSPSRPEMQQKEESAVKRDAPPMSKEDFLARRRMIRERQVMRKKVRESLLSSFEEEKDEKKKGG